MSCQTCKHLGITESMKGYAEKMKVNPLHFNYGYCRVNNKFVDKTESCTNYEKIN